LIVVERLSIMMKAIVDTRLFKDDESYYDGCFRRVLTYWDVVDSS